MIEIENISKSYSNTRALRKITTSIRKGELVAFLGPNGSGKTTMIKIILGLVKPTKGSIAIDGDRITNDWFYRSKIGYMSQIANFPENLTADELFNMVISIRRQEPVFKQDLIERFKLSDSLNKPLKALSGGTKQKVNAVMALMFDVPILILDEPTVGLDPESARIFKHFVLEQNKLGKTIIFSSHVMYDIEELSQKVFILQDGYMIYNGTLEELKLQTNANGIEEALVEITKRSQIS